MISTRHKPVWAFCFSLVPLSLLVLGGVDQRLTVTVLHEYPHDPAAYTQGLVLYQDRLFESTGLYGASSLREEDPRTGEVLRSVSLPPNEFGEGLALVGDRLIQLTWREGIAHVYNRDTFERTGDFIYSGEGWGLTYDGARLIMSDGSSRLYFRSTATFDVVSSVTVTLDSKPLSKLNELEYAGGYVYANVYQTETIAKIDPGTGRVVGVIDASGLRPLLDSSTAEVLNGIAYDAVDRTFLVTGKRWPKLFEPVRR